MRFHDLTRQRVRDHPCWIGTQYIIPRIDFFPEKSGGWRIETVIPVGDGRFEVIGRHLATEDEIIALLSAWEGNPEEALMIWWERELPRMERGKQVAKVEMDI